MQLALVRTEESVSHRERNMANDKSLYIINQIILALINEIDLDLLEFIMFSSTSRSRI